MGFLTEAQVTEVGDMLAEIKEARERRDFPKSDAIRERLKEKWGLKASYYDQTDSYKIMALVRRNGALGWCEICA